VLAVLLDLSEISDPFLHFALHEKPQRNPLLEYNLPYHVSLSANLHHFEISCCPKVNKNVVQV